jgi:hypothetical protein
MVANEDHLASKTLQGAEIHYLMETSVARHLINASRLQFALLRVFLDYGYEFKIIFRGDNETWAFTDAVGASALSATFTADSAASARCSAAMTPGCSTSAISIAW